MNSLEDPLVMINSTTLNTWKFLEKKKNLKNSHHTQKVETI